MDYIIIQISEVLYNQCLDFYLGLGLDRGCKIVSIFRGCMVWIQKSVTKVTDRHQEVTDRHHEACLVMLAS